MHQHSVHCSHNTSIAALEDEVLALGRDGRLGGERDLLGMQHDLIAQYLLLAAALAKRPPAIQHLVQHYTHRPHIHLHAPGTDHVPGSLQSI